MKLPEKIAKMFLDTNFGFVSTLNKDGSPQLTTVWVDYDGRHILFNTAEGRAKPKNLRKDPRVAVAIADKGNPYQFATVRGKVVEMTHDGADAHIDKMAKKYLNQDKYPFRQPGEKRLIVKIEPQKIASWPPDLAAGK
jgi:PPOX class probable F420-dependent enzyme